MTVLSAVVTGPTHAIARQWLAGHPREPLRGYLDPLARAAAAALASPPAAAARLGHDGARQGRMRLQIVSGDGSIVAEGEATVDLLPPPGVV